ncbi:FkbM family methyltransferase [Mycolicibacterium austroafricanum]|uniref:FkbM family methyltransferase n=1 Tax=Mycolicibacterium austroafricanum TaxID=39687 RepID=UPI001CA323B3|nr:FkbM family methyltransferase [Mycolicibacterium austroafricanum]QZT58432.1 FkbM family methyltransferase [Mycolicibacterium austroafricanum]
MQLKKAVRTAQTYAAPLLEAKVWTQRKVRSALRMPSEPSYRAFERFPFDAGLEFLDIGSNRGQTIASLRLYRPSVPILGFEPNPILMRRLSKLYNSDRSTEIFPFGLGIESGKFDLYIPHYRGFMFDGLASFDWSSAHGWLNADRIYGFNERHLKVERVQCEIRRWDDIDTRPGLVKIDVQGFEKNVLLGGLETIRRFRPVFLIENDPERAHEETLFAEGYRRAAYSNSHLIPDTFGVGNTFYIPEEKFSRLEAAYAG